METAKDMFDRMLDENDECTTTEMMIEFAKMHVKEALKYALDDVPYGGSDEVRYEDVVGILTCYPLENIK